MTDLLIRDTPDGVLAAIDARASRLGLSRTEYLRRRMTQDAAVSGGEVAVDDQSLRMQPNGRHGSGVACCTSPL